MQIYECTKVDLVLFLPIFLNLSFSKQENAFIKGAEGKRMDVKTCAKTLYSSETRWVHVEIAPERLIISFLTKYTILL